MTGIDARVKALEARASRVADTATQNVVALLSELPAARRGEAVAVLDELTNAAVDGYTNAGAEARLAALLEVC